MALPDDASKQLRTDIEAIEAWYCARTGPAHGDGIGKYDIPTLLEPPALDAMLTQMDKP
jgi:hypothetical protein